MPGESRTILTVAVATELAVATVITATIVSFGYRFLVYLPSFPPGSSHVENLSDLEAALLGTLLYSIAGMGAMAVTIMLMRWRRPTTWLAIFEAAVGGPTAIVLPGFLILALGWGIPRAAAFVAVLAVVGSSLYFLVLAAAFARSKGSAARMGDT